MTCKIHLASDGKGRPLGLLLTGGNAADTSFFTTVLDTICVHDGRPGRPRTRPDRVLADKAYTSTANRRFLTDRRVKVTIPEREDQKAGRARRGSAGGRPRTFDAEAYKGRNVVERCFNRLKQWRGIATRSDKTARSYLAGLTLAAALCGHDDALYQHDLGAGAAVGTRAEPARVPTSELPGRDDLGAARPWTSSNRQLDQGDVS
jgi:transposase